MSPLDPQPGAARSEDGTTIGYLSLGSGPGLVLVGGVLSAAARTLLLAGAKSPSELAVELLPQLAQVIPNAQARILAGLGHAAPQDDPEPIAEAILAAHEGRAVAAGAADIPASSPAPAPQ